MCISARIPIHSEYRKFASRPDPTLEATKTRTKQPSSSTNGKVKVQKSASKKSASKNRTNARQKKPKKVREAAEGDISPVLDSKGLEEFVIDESIDAAQQSKITAVRDIIDKTPPHDIHTLARTLEVIIGGASSEDATILRNALLKK